MNSQKPAFREAALSATRQISHASAHSFIVLNEGVPYRCSALASGEIAIRDTLHTVGSFAVFIETMNNPKVVAASSSQFKEQISKFVAAVKEDPRRQFNTLSDAIVEREPALATPNSNASMLQNKAQWMR